MIFISKVISNVIESGRQLVKHLRFGDADVLEDPQATPAGIDSAPIKDMKAVYATTSSIDQSVVVGYIPVDSKAEPGEIRIFSMDDDGNEQTFIWVKKDGSIEIGGDADFAVGFDQTKKSIDELKDDINNLKNIFSAWVPVPTDGGAALKAALAPYIAQPIIEQIDNGKKDDVKLP